MKIVPFSPEHIGQIRGNNLDKEYTKERRRQLTLDELQQLCIGPYSVAYTVIVDDAPVLATGMLKYKSSGLAWVYAGKMSLGTLFQVCKIAKRAIPGVMVSLNLTVCETAVLNSFSEANRFAQAVGFEPSTPEAPLPQWVEFCPMDDADFIFLRKSI